MHEHVPVRLSAQLFLPNSRKQGWSVFGNPTRLRAVRQTAFDRIPEQGMLGREKVHNRKGEEIPTIQPGVLPASGVPGSVGSPKPKRYHKNSRHIYDHPCTASGGPASGSPPVCFARNSPPCLALLRLHVLPKRPIST